MVLAPIEEKKDDPLEEAEDHSMNSGDYPKRRIKQSPIKKGDESSTSPKVEEEEKEVEEEPNN